ncbi:MAG: nitrogen fixation protein NifQ [Beijerinckiaceae bacterium]|nr:nitrogen fixation protein NifQ [Beijerinckiaceae bacterium]
MPMRADEIYPWLMEASEGSGMDPFDVHVCASILAMGLGESAVEGVSVCKLVGLDGNSLRCLIEGMFPGVAGQFDETFKPCALTIDAEEQSLRDILWMYASSHGPLHRDLTAMIARRCIRPHHLWQDLGFRNRGELSRLMTRHFSLLAAKNRGDMKWKKFLYRMVCGTEGFTFCAAPVCSDCDDFALCFGAEDGESLLAQANFAQAATV